MLGTWGRSPRTVSADRCQNAAHSSACTALRDAKRLTETICDHETVILNDLGSAWTTSIEVIACQLKTTSVFQHRDNRMFDIEIDAMGLLEAIVDAHGPQALRVSEFGVADHSIELANAARTLGDFAQIVFQLVEPYCVWVVAHRRNRAVTDEMDLDRHDFSSPLLVCWRSSPAI